MTAGYERIHLDGVKLWRPRIPDGGQQDAGSGLPIHRSAGRTQRSEVDGKEKNFKLHSPYRRLRAFPGAIRGNEDRAEECELVFGCTQEGVE